MGLHACNLLPVCNQEILLWTVALNKIGLGDGCHWCTEGVFELLLGVACVNQGRITSNGKNSDYSKAVEAYFDPAVFSLSELIEIHLYTHASRSSHSMRHKYLSAVYGYDDSTFEQAADIPNDLRTEFDEALITQAYPFKDLKKE